MSNELTDVEKSLLNKIIEKDEFTEGAYNVRGNGKGICSYTCSNN